MKVIPTLSLPVGYKVVRRNGEVIVVWVGQ